MALAGNLDQPLAVEEEVDQVLAVAAGDDDRLWPQLEHAAGEVLLTCFFPSPVNSRASGILGVATAHCGSRWSTSASLASSSSSTAPLSATITGSITTGASATPR